MIKNMFAAFLIAPAHLIQRLLFFFFILQLLSSIFHKTRANAQQVLSAQTGLYRYDEWRVQKINDGKLYVNET